MNSNPKTNDWLFDKKRISRKLKELFGIRNSLAICRSKEELVNKSIEIALSKLRSQTASVFLFSKNGLLERVAIKGIDREGQPISNKWYSNERYHEGESFSGRVVAPQNHSDYGLPQWSNKLSEQSAINLESKSKYLEMLGGLNCAISVPLNGRNRTFGALEVINKLDKGGKPNGSLGFTQDDVYLLSMIGIQLGHFISFDRHKSEIELISGITNLLVEPFNTGNYDNSVYEKVASGLVTKISNYRAVIIRIVDNDGRLVTVAKKGDNIKWFDKIDKPIISKSSYASRVLINGEEIIISDLDAHLDEFQNRSWIKTNKLKSYICIPLQSNNKTVGTLSLFTGFIHMFYPSDLKHLREIAHLIASYVESINMVTELNRLRIEAEIGQKTTLSDSIPHSLLHDYKHDLQDWHSMLSKAIESGSNNRILSIVRKVNFELSEKIRELTNEIGNKISSEEHVDINQTIQEVVRYHNLQLRGKHPEIIITQQKLKEIPLLSIKKDGIWEIVSNLLSNATTAIKAANRSEGLIYVRSDIIEKEIPYVIITVEDNGVGIGNEIKKEIFKKGFTTTENGTGLGLFIVSSIIEDNLGGRIVVDSKVGKWTKVSVLIPKTRYEYS